MGMLQKYRRMGTTGMCVPLEMTKGYYRGGKYVLYPGFLYIRPGGQTFRLPHSLTF